MNNSKLASPDLTFCDNPEFRRHGWIWWIFSLYYFIPVFYTPFDWFKHSVMIAGYAVFILLCIFCARSRPSRAWIPISSLLLLAIVISPVTPGASTVLTYASFFIGFYFSLRKAMLWFAATGLIILALQLYFKYPFPYFAFPAATGIIAVGFIGAVEQFRQRTKAKEQQSLLEIRQLAMIAERERIARDLHDLLGHTLSSIALKTELASKLLQQKKYQEGEQHLTELNQIARDTLSLVRQTVSGYKHRGLTGEVMQLCEQLRESNVSVTLEGVIPQLNARAETALIFTLKELTTNVLRHSQGQKCTLSFHQGQHDVVITLCDDGRITSLGEGNGLRGIRERLHALAGTLTIDLHERSCFTITLPLDVLSHTDEPKP